MFYPYLIKKIDEKYILRISESSEWNIKTIMGMPPEIDAPPTQTCQWWPNNFLRMRKNLYGKVFRVRGKVLRLHGKVFHLHGKAFHWVFSPSLLFSVWKHEWFVNKPSRKSDKYQFNQMNPARHCDVFITSRRNNGKKGKILSANICAFCVIPNSTFFTLHSSFSFNWHSPSILLTHSFECNKSPSPQRFSSEPSLELLRGLAIDLTSTRAFSWTKEVLQ